MKPAIFRNKLAQLPRSWAFWLTLVLLGLVRVVVVEDGQQKRYLFLSAWEQGRVEFVNSVTGKPVLLEFRPFFRFQDFQAYTDPETEAYYTGGVYPWNQALAQERKRELAYCSELGLALGLGGRWFRTQGGCLRLRLLFPP
ncbi:hypothetical protein [Thermus sp. NMX2.A1]|uniref:hypothetical protein n=1 Tax=Thermus sp. NMX2.A1 TaxID=570924 RepID=UPI0003DBD4EF|nr:hypothetical protein [Thermus sp. NMX2.A1]ETN87496.1 hypothetical protein TNMX_11885 [Thermus sp. NMX2.A1]